MPGILHYLFVADSRGNNFDHYPTPSVSDISVNFILQRGATVSDLILPTLIIIIIIIGKAAHI